MTDEKLIEEINSKSEYNAEDLIKITTLLRHKCPWDAEQTHESVRQCFIEEVYEACDAIDRADAANLCEELGDVLFQVLFHAELAREDGAFTLEDVINGVSRKLIIRHPHVFGNVAVANTAEVLSNWDKIKAKEKGQTKAADPVKDVPRALPSLMRAQKLSKRAAKAGLYNLPERYTGMTEDESKKALGAELFELAGAAEASGISAEEALYEKNNRFLAEIQ